MNLRPLQLGTKQRSVFMVLAGVHLAGRVEKAGRVVAKHLQEYVLKSSPRRRWAFQPEKMSRGPLKESQRETKRPCSIPLARVACRGAEPRDSRRVYSLRLPRVISRLLVIRKPRDWRMLLVCILLHLHSRSTRIFFFFFSRNGTGLARTPLSSVSTPTPMVGTPPEDGNAWCNGGTHGEVILHELHRL